MRTQPDQQGSVMESLISTLPLPIAEWVEEHEFTVTILREPGTRSFRLRLPFGRDRNNLQVYLTS
jgi:hypothetical protein